MFINTDLETILSHLDKLTATTPAKWGKMTPQQMIEHLTDTINMALERQSYDLQIPIEKIPGMVQFLESDKELPKDFKVIFATENSPLRNEELELAIDEFVDAFLEFEEKMFDENFKASHPYYGELNFVQWDRLNSKHLTHHFKQFGLID